MSSHEPKLITCIIRADEPEPERQIRAAAIAEAVSQGLVLDGKPRVRRVMHKGKRYLEATYPTRPESYTDR